jgi:hypothetical protein
MRGCKVQNIRRPLKIKKMSIFTPSSAKSFLNKVNRSINGGIENEEDR